MMAAPLVLLSLLAPGPGDDVASKVMAEFGYPGFKAPGVRTESGGTVFEEGPILLRLDAQGRPRTFKIRGVKFERSDAGKARTKIARLLAKYPLPLPKGQWRTERPKAPDVPFGMASSSVRYDFVPVVHGYPFLGGSQMTVQFSSDLKKVLEWAHHPWKVEACVVPKKLLGRAEALRVFERNAANHVRGVPNAFYRMEASRLRLGWVHVTRPRLAYAVPVMFFRKSAMGTKGGGGIELIDAATGTPLPWSEPRPIRRSTGEPPGKPQRA